LISDASLEVIFREEQAVVSAAAAVVNPVAAAPGVMTCKINSSS